MLVFLTNGLEGNGEFEQDWLMTGSYEAGSKRQLL
jgi:hypothetical protein